MAAYWRILQISRRDQKTNMELVNAHSISVFRFNGHFPGGPSLAGIRMSPFWILLKLRMTGMVVTTGAIRHAKLQSKRHHQHTNAQFSTGRMPFLSPNRQCQSTDGKKSVNEVDLNSCLCQLLQ